MSADTAPAAAVNANTDSAPATRQVLSLWDAVMITVGIVIGVGIFQTPGMVADATGSAGLMIGAWVLGGVLSFIGALNYAELASTYPSTGGDYDFLRRAFGRQVSFLFAWARGMVIVTGSIALLGFILGDYLSRLWNLGEHSSAIYATVAVLALTAVNLIGLKASARMQNVLTALEVGGVLLVAVVAVSLGMQSEPAAAIEATSSSGGIGAFGLAMVFVLLTFGGWNEAAYVSAEVRGGPRVMLKVLALSIIAISVVYVAFVSAITYGLGFEALRNADAIAIQVMEGRFGSAGAQIIGLTVVIASLTSMNSTMLVGARTNYSVAHDWPAFSFLGSWRGARNLPLTGFLVQAGIALALIGFGSMEKDGFSTMVEFTAPVFWFFFLLSGVSLLILRRKDPHAVRPFKVPLYPIIPLVFIATCAYLLYSSIMYAQSQRAGYVALLVTASGVVVLAILEVMRKRRAG